MQYPGTSLQPALNMIVNNMVHNDKVLTKPFIVRVRKLGEKLAKNP